MSDYGFLPVFRDLIITGGAGEIVRIGDVLEARLHVGWSRDQTREKEASRFEGSDGLEWLVFNRDATPEIPAASLFLSVQGDDLAVTNIVPQVVSQLLRQQYNLILAEFFEKVAEPACRDLNLRCTLTEDSLPITHWVSEEAASRLLRFSRLANKATGSAHPLDRKRWFAFIFQTVQDKSSLDAQTLGQWLVSIGHWPEEAAHDLMIEFEFGRDLLRYAATQ